MKGPSKQQIKLFLNNYNLKNCSLRIYNKNQLRLFSIAMSDVDYFKFKYDNHLIIQIELQRQYIQDKDRNIIADRINLCYDTKDTTNMILTNTVFQEEIAMFEEIEKAILSIILQYPHFIKNRLRPAIPYYFRAK